MQSSDPLVIIDEDRLHQEFNRSPFLVRHRLSDHPLFEFPRLMQLCRDLPEDRVEYNGGNLSINQDSALTPHTGLSPEETIRRIAECSSWLVLKNVERDPDYRDLLNEVLEPLRGEVPSMHALEGFVFVSSPNAVTPYHMDPEHNFLLQVRGTKQVNIFDQKDSSLLSAEELETFYCADKHRNMEYRKEYDDKAEVFDLTPGMGLHFPVTAPHWVKVGPEVSVSFSVTFRSEESRRHSVLHAINRQIRRLGLRPSPVGRSRLSDNSKYLAYKAYRGAKDRILRRHR
jgi:hypothetical protein